MFNKKELYYEGASHLLDPRKKKSNNIKEHQENIREWEEKLKEHTIKVKEWEQRDNERRKKNSELHQQYMKKYDDMFFLDDNKTWYNMLCEFDNCKNTFNPDAPRRWDYGYLNDVKPYSLKKYDEKKDYRKIFISIYKEYDMNRTGPDREWIKCEENPYFIDATNKLRELLERHGMNVPYFETYCYAYNPKDEIEPEEEIIPLEPRPVLLIHTEVLSDEDEKNIDAKNKR